MPDEVADVLTQCGRQKETGMSLEAGKAVRDIATWKGTDKPTVPVNIRVLTEIIYELK